MDRLKGIKNSVAGKFSSRQDNPFGENLHDLVRKATAKTLIYPDEELNQQVVVAVREDAYLGKDSKEIVALLKKRLRTDNPQKQWLAVVLCQKVAEECRDTLALYLEELLQEVAKVVAHPAKPDQQAGQMARGAAKDLLQSHGRAGTTAFRPFNQHADPYQYRYAPAHPYTNTSLMHPTQAYPGQGHRRNARAFNVERQSVLEEVSMIIEKARSNSELLSDMLVNDGSAEHNDFENELLRDLRTEVTELKSLLTAYLEQMQGMGGLEIEQLVVQALEASDMLDNALTLQRDVSDNKALPPDSSHNIARPAQAPHSNAPAPQSAAPANGGGRGGGDLIAFDDLGLDQAPPQHFYGPGAQDPFAASAFVPVTPSSATGGPPPATGAGLPPAPPGGAMKSAFESMFQDPAAMAAFSDLQDAAAPSAVMPPPPPHDANGYEQQQRLALQQQLQQQQMAMQQQQDQAAQHIYQQQLAQQQQLLQQQQYQAEMMRLQAAPGQAQTQPPAATFGPNTDLDMLPVLQPFNNPFFDPLGAPVSSQSPMPSVPLPNMEQYGAAAGGAPPAARMYQEGISPMGGQPPDAYGYNPGGDVGRGQGGGGGGAPERAAADAEWDLFFADRVGGGPQPPPPQLPVTQR